MSVTQLSPPARASAAGSEAWVARAPDRRLILAVPVLLTLHNLEELLAAPRFIFSVAVRLPDIAISLPVAPTPASFALALAVVTLAAWGIALAALAGRGTALYLLLVVQATMLVNVASHLLTAAAFGGYAPGLVTALLVNLPFSVHLLARARRWIGPGAWAMLFPAALVIHGPVLIGLLWISGRITGAS